MLKKLKIMVLLSSVVMLANTAFAGENAGEWLASFERMKGVKPVTDRTYAKECGECHFAYPAGLLPSASWEKLLNATALKNHFGDNAEMDAATLERVLDYATNNAAEKSWYKRARKIANSGQAPLRITELRYIKRVHEEIPEKMIKANAQVKSLSQCSACHTQAAKGVFDSDTVSIPNYPDFD
jgi:Dihaem cytochrome c